MLFTSLQSWYGYGVWLEYVPHRFMFWKLGPSVMVPRDDRTFKKRSILMGGEWVTITLKNGLMMSQGNHI